MEKLLLLITQYSYFGIFFALALGILGLPIPDETLMTFTGFLAYKGSLHFPTALSIAFLGSACGITLGYFLGRFFGYPFLEKYAQKLRLNPKHIHDAETWYKKYGRFALFIGYFVLGVRHFTAIFAGISQMPYRQFALYAYSGGFLWTLAFVSLGYYLGEKWRIVVKYAHHYSLFLTIASVAAIVIYYIGKNSIKSKQK